MDHTTSRKPLSSQEGRGFHFAAGRETHDAYAAPTWLRCGAVRWYRPARRCARRVGPRLELPYQAVGGCAGPGSIGGVGFTHGLSGL